MKNWKSLMITALSLTAMWNAPVTLGQSTQPQTNSVKSSPSSDTDVNDVVPSSEVKVPSKARNAELETRTLVSSCMATAVELEKTRILVGALESENSTLKTRLETEKRAMAILSELNETRKSEADALKAALAAKNETIAAKDAVIASQDKLVAALKTKKSSPWRRLGDVLIGAAVFAILK